MRQMVLVCDDSCNSFSPSPPPLFFPLGFPLVSLLFFASKQARCATWAERASESGSWASRHGHRASHLTWLHSGAADFLLARCILPLHCLSVWCPFYPTSPHKVHQKVGKLGPPGSVKSTFIHFIFPISTHTAVSSTNCILMLQFCIIKISMRMDMNHQPPQPKLRFHDMKDFLHCSCKGNSLAAYEHSL